MACLDYATWLKATHDCQAMTAVKGFGGLRGLGATVNLNIAPPSASDPCIIAQQTPCPQPSPPSLKAPPTPQASCAANPASLPCQPGGSLFCRINPTDYTCQSPLLTTTPDSFNPAAANTAGGFNQWGLLAALAVGGTAIYFLTRKKKASAA